MFSLSQFRRLGLFRLSSVAAGAILLGGCSMPMGNLMGGGSDKPDVTSSAPAPQSGRSTAAAGQSSMQLASAPGPAGANPLNSNDWNYARGALGLALTSTHGGPPVPWANPETGARGNFAPASEAVTAEGRMCRDFVATRSENGKEVQLRGRACRTADGQWDIAETTRTTL